MLVLDCVPYFQEDRIWRLRYETLRDVVDGFVVVEARQTHSGAEKPLTFEMHKKHWPWIWYWPVDLPDPGVAGVPATRRREMTQRNHIVGAVNQAAISELVSVTSASLDDAILLISDCDEIPHPDAVRAIRERGLSDGEIVVFLQTLYYYNLNTRSPQPWPGTRAARWADVAALSPHVVRCGLGQPDAHYPIYLQTPPGAGWHLSYFGGPDAVKRKMESFLHQELRTDQNTDPAAIAAAINAGRDVWGRPNEGHGITLGPADLASLPAPIRENPAAWAAFFHEEYQP